MCYHLERPSVKLQCAIQMLLPCDIRQRLSIALSLQAQEVRPLAPCQGDLPLALSIQGHARHMPSDTSNSRPLHSHFVDAQAPCPLAWPYNRAPLSVQSTLSHKARASPILPDGERQSPQCTSHVKEVSTCPLPSGGNVRLRNRRVCFGKPPSTYETLGLAMQGAGHRRPGPMQDSVQPHGRMAASHQQPASIIDSMPRSPNSIYAVLYKHMPAHVRVIRITKKKRSVFL